MYTKTVVLGRCCLLRKVTRHVHSLRSWGALCRLTYDRFPTEQWCTLLMFLVLYPVDDMYLCVTDGLPAAETGGPETARPGHRCRRWGGRVHTPAGWRPTDHGACPSGRLSPLSQHGVKRGAFPAKHHACQVTGHWQQLPREVAQQRAQWAQGDAGRHGVVQRDPPTLHGHHTGDGAGQTHLLLPWVLTTDRAQAPAGESLLLSAKHEQWPAEGGRSGLWPGPGRCLWHVCRCHERQRGRGLPVLVRVQPGRAWAGGRGLQQPTEQDEPAAGVSQWEALLHRRLHSGAEA